MRDGARTDGGLTLRQETLLHAVITAYVADGQPVGSKTLVERGVVSASSSTVRYDLAALEERGMLDHPHTSAGRVPTEAGYRYYADILLRTPAEPEPLAAPMRNQELDDALQETAEALSRTTSLLAAISAPSQQAVTLRHVELLPLNATTVIAIAITSTGEVGKRRLAFEQPLDPGLLDWATAYLHERIVGQRVGSSSLRQRLEDQGLSPSERVFLGALAPLFSGLGSERELVVGGASALLDRLGTREVEAVRDVVGALEDRHALLSALREALEGGGVTIRIGSELGPPALHGLSVVAGGYGPAHRAVGTVSLLGPTRMDYARAIRAVRGASAALSELVDDAWAE